MTRQPVQAQMSMSHRAWAELLLLSLVWGGSFLAFAVALQEIGVASIVAHRVVWAALLLWIIALIRGIPIPKGVQIWAACLVMGLLNNVIPFSLIAWGQTTIESGLAAILNASTAFFGILLAALAFGDEKLTRRKLLGVSLGILGVVVIIGIDALARLDLRSLAQLAILGASLSYGCAAVWARKTLHSLPPQSAALGMLTGSSLIIMPLAIAIDGPPTANLAPATIAAIAYISLMATAVAYLLYYRVLAMAGSGNLMLVTIIISPIAILLGALILGESLSPTAYLGFGILTFGLLIIDGRILRQ